MYQGAVILKNQQQEEGSVRSQNGKRGIVTKDLPVPR